MARQAVAGRSRWRRALAPYLRNWDLYMLLIPSIVLYITFNYAPMYGVQIAFRNYSSKLGIVGSKWVGLKHFERFFRSTTPAGSSSTRWASACIRCWPDSPFPSSWPS